MESHLIIKGLNSEGSVLSFFARSALKSRKRFPGGVLEPGHYVEIEYCAPSRVDGWNQLKSASILHAFDKKTRVKRREFNLIYCMFI